MPIKAHELNKFIQWEKECDSSTATRYIINLRDADSIRDTDRGYVIRDREIRDAFREWRASRGERREKGEEWGGESEGEEKKMERKDGKEKKDEAKEKSEKKEKKPEKKDKKSDAPKSEKKESSKGSKKEKKGISEGKLNKCIQWEKNCSEAGASRYIINLLNYGSIEDSDTGFVLMDAELKDMWAEWKEMK
ncbi:uncharacterized protein RAG0_11948 [Rhynchosporium agropyri]|uniref:Uncharacterized protein n=1 Tax=Rhynchosporium agropyri TaxID=914238 RepID=A0A1E1L6S1_9HELO|nr:uncharacterized protein RAG0_11948 [Rhynchosporium agropyri]